MIDHLEGEFREIGADYAVIRLGGMGIRVALPRSVADRLRGRECGCLLTRLVIRDGEPQLYGFERPEERRAFDALLGVTGVGARIALAILSQLSPEDLSVETERGSVTRLLTVSGVGKKLASRIVLELKGRLPEDVGTAGPFSGSGSDLAADAVRALTALGFPLGESREAVRQILADPAEGPATPLDRVVRLSIRRLGGERA